MDDRQIRCFLQVCKDHSISKAAQNLYMSQQGLSSSIQRLEQSLGVSLFDRTRSGVKLTKYGIYVREQLERIESIRSNMYSTIAAMRSEEEAVLDIAVSFGVISALHPDLISHFYELFPGVKLRLHESSDLVAEQNIFQEKYELGFSIAPIDNKRFLSHAIVKDRLCLLISKKNPLYKLKSPGISDLRGQDILSLTNEFKLRKTFEKRCQAFGFKPNISLETMELVLIHNFSALNRGIGTSVYFIAKDIPDVRAVPLDSPECDWKVCLIRRKDGVLSAAAQAFWDYVCSQPCFYPDKEG